MQFSAVCLYPSSTRGGPKPFNIGKSEYIPLNTCHLVQVNVVLEPFKMIGGNWSGKSNRC